MPELVDTMHRAMRSVLRPSIRHGRVPARRGWLNAVRGTDAPACPRSGRPLKTRKTAGRTASWCPRCQS